MTKKVTFHIIIGRSRREREADSGTNVQLSTNQAATIRASMFAFSVALPEGLVRD